MNVNKIFSFLILLLSLESYALTPQKYCESLPATSCELLNIEAGGCTDNANACSIIIKYCRNQQYRIHPTAQYVTNSPNYSVQYKTAGGSSASFGNGATPTYKSSASLCADLP